MKTAILVLTKIAVGLIILRAAYRVGLVAGVVPVAGWIAGVGALLLALDDLLSVWMASKVERVRQELNDLCEPPMSGYISGSLRLDNTPATEFACNQALVVYAKTGKKPQRIPDGCNGCKHLHGETYGGELLVCGMHPYGEEECGDFESRDLLSPEFKEMAHRLGLSEEQIDREALNAADQHANEMIIPPRSIDHPLPGCLEPRRLTFTVRQDMVATGQLIRIRILRMRDEIDPAYTMFRVIRKSVIIANVFEIEAIEVLENS
jgi:hypothetical protein